MKLYMSDLLCSGEMMARKHMERTAETVDVRDVLLKYKGGFPRP
jgi:hypothetical protein